MKWFVIVALLLVQPLAMAKGKKPKLTDDNIKSCMAEIYTKQILYINEHGRYAKNSKELGITKNVICKGVNLNYELADKEKFKIRAKAGKLVWLIDDEKNMQKIK
jgi:hypothetical protein